MTHPPPPRSAPVSPASKPPPPSPHHPPHRPHPQSSMLPAPPAAHAASPPAPGAPNPPQSTAMPPPPPLRRLSAPLRPPGPRKWTRLLAARPPMARHARPARARRHRDATAARDTTHCPPLAEGCPARSIAKRYGPRRPFHARRPLPRRDSRAQRHPDPCACMRARRRCGKGRPARRIAQKRCIARSTN